MRKLFAIAGSALQSTHPPIANSDLCNGASVFGHVRVHGGE